MQDALGAEMVEKSRVLEQEQREMQAAHASELEALRSHADAQERSASTLRSRVDAVRSQSKDDMAASVAASVAAADEEKRRLEAETAQRAQEMEEQMSAMQAAHESALEAMRARADEEREAAVSEASSEAAAAQSNPRLDDAEQQSHTHTEKPFSRKQNLQLVALAVLIVVQLHVHDQQPQDKV